MDNQPSSARGRRPPASKIIIPIVFLSIVFAMITISFVLTIVNTVHRSNLNILLGTALIGLAIVQILMVLFARSGAIIRQRSWIVYIVGLVIITESVLTNVVVFNA